MRHTEFWYLFRACTELSHSTDPTPYPPSNAALSAYHPLAIRTVFQ
jgi:hypothetical protein